MARHSTRIANLARDQLVLGGIAVMIIAAVIVLAIHFSSSVLQPATIAVSTPTQTPTATPKQTTTPTPVATQVPLVVPTTPTPSVASTPPLPNLKAEVGNGGVNFVFPSIGFNQPLVPLEVTYDQTGQAILPQDVRAYLATNLSPRNCEISGGDFIFGHTSIYTDYWGFVPFNAFKTLSPGSSGQQFSIGSHRYEAQQIIVQPKAQLTTTKEFWCQPAGNVSIVSCYTQEESGDNIIVIGRLIS